MLPALKLAASSLRDYYLEVINGNLYATVLLQSALRQAVALCASTGDIFALRNLVRSLELAARQAHNQTLYVSIVADVVLSRNDLSDLERRELCGWAAAAAYEAGDSPTAAKLIETLPELRPYDMALLACCYGVVNRHENARQLAARLIHTGKGITSHAALAGKLIEFVSLFAIGKKTEAAAIHSALLHSAEYLVSPLFGFVLRFTELIKDFPDCTADVLASIKTFQRSGLRKSAAYSELAAAMHLAYTGELSRARRLVADAQQELQPYLHDQQILVNNAVVIDLLSEKPNLLRCIDELKASLLAVADDFTRLTLHNNLLVCFALREDISHAAHTIDVIDRVLAAPCFGNRDIFVTVCYNVWRFLKDTDQPEKAARYKEVALSVNLETSCYPSYWKVRFGLELSAEPQFDFLLRLKFHPDYLSHWLIDLDGLDVLKEESVL
jgi:hypothetical protein